MFSAWWLRFSFMDPISTPWLILLAYWVISAFRVRATERAEPAWSRFATIAAILVGIELLAGHWFSSRFLGSRFVPNSPGVRYAGIFLVWLGVAGAIWARYHLGEFWSARVTIKIGHRVIESGPYSYIRHPIYSGVLLGLVGTALAGGQWRQVGAFFLVLIVFFFKARREEKMLTARLGTEYEEYKSRTGMLIPRMG